MLVKNNHGLPQKVKMMLEQTIDEAWAARQDEGRRPALEDMAQRALAKRESLELIHEIIGIDTETKFKAVKCKLARDATLPGGP